MNHEPVTRIYLSNYRTVLFLMAWSLLGIFTVSCQKSLKLKYDIAEIKQVIIGNLYPGSKLRVNISKSKQPDDFSAVEFLMNCKVDLYEDSIFKETMTFKLKDTLSGLGYYTSSFLLNENKTYKIVSTHPELGIAEATEYLPSRPKLIYATLSQQADSAHTRITGKYSVIFEDSANLNNYYFISAFYQILKPVISELGDTTYVYDYIFNIPSYTPEIPNPSNYNRSFFTDAGFDGQVKSFTFDFPSQYNTVYKEITFIVQLANTGKNFYDWNVQQIPLGQDFLNEGQQERANLKSNIINGYGHFTAYSDSYFTVRVR